jgi:hypothetical protein
MRVERDWLRKLVFEMSGTRRFTQESPILPEVWLSGGVAYCRDPEVRVDLLLTPHKDQTAAILARAILDGLEVAFAAREYVPAGAAYGPLGKSDDAPLTKPTWTVSVNQTTVAASLTFKELITCVLPLSTWWARNFRTPTKAAKPPTRRELDMREDEIRWMRRLVGVIALCASQRTGPPARRVAEADDPWTATQTDRRAEGATIADYNAFCQAREDEAGQQKIFEEWIADANRWARHRLDKRGAAREPSLWSISLNRQSMTAITLSVPATKSDAARRVCDI